MNVARLARVLVLALCASLAACASQRGARSALETALYDYESAIRWGDFTGAAGFLDPKMLESQPLRAIDLKRYEQIQVTGYQEGGAAQPSETEFRQTVEIRLVNRHTQAERAVVDHQRWRYDAELKRWWLTSGLPDITESR